MPDNPNGPAEIGVVTGLSGDVYAESASGMRALEPGSPIYQGEELVTGAGGNVEIRFVDDTLLSQGEDSRISLDDYVFDDSGASDFMVNIAQGTFRMVTGKIAEQNPERFKVGTPLATIGIRGTTTVHEVIPGQGEKHGVEQIHSGKALVVQSNITGAVRQIGQSMGLVDVSSSGSLSPVRPLSMQEFNSFREIAPSNIQQEQDIQEQRNDEREEDEDAPVDDQIDEQTDDQQGEGQEGEGQEGEDQQGEGQQETPQGEQSPVEQPGELPQDVSPGGESGQEGEELGGVLHPEGGLESGNSPLADQRDFNPIQIDRPELPGEEKSVDNESLEKAVVQEQVNADQTGGEDGDGLAAEDSLLAGSATQTSGTGTDTQTGGTGGDELTDDTGDTGTGDTGTGETGDDTQSGGTGDDTGGGDTPVVPSVITGTSAADTLVGGDGSQTITGLQGDDELYGKAGDDTLYGNEGEDALNGGAGNDYLDGGTGAAGEVDFASYADATGSVSVCLTDGTSTGADGQDSLISIEGIIGSNYDDYLAGDSGDNKFEPLLGNDVVIGGAGSDTISFEILSNDVNVTISTSTGSASIESGGTVISTISLDSIENIKGGSGNDELYGSTAANTIKGRDGNDSISSDDGNDFVYGGSGSDSIDGGAGDDTLYGEAGNDVITGGTGNDYIEGGTDNNTLSGGDGNDSIQGGTGFDTVSYDYATTGVTVDLSMGSTVVTVSGSDIDTIDGVENAIGSGYDDVLLAYMGGSSLSGGAGSDILVGDVGTDYMWGGDGDDYFSGGGGYNSMDGGACLDTIDFSLAASAVTVDMSTGSDEVYTNAGADVDAFSNMEKVIGSDFNDHITDYSGDSTVDAGLGNDTVVGGSGIDYLVGGDGVDTIDYSYYTAGGVNVDLLAGAATVVSGTDEDTLVDFEVVIGTDNADTISAVTYVDQSLYGGGGNDSILGGWSNDYIAGGDGNDSINAHEGDDTVYGGAGDDNIDGSNGTNTIYGGAGKDTITSSSGDDYIDGGIDDDFIQGNDGNDTLIGGDGADSITSTGGNNTITGDAGDDKISDGAGAATVTGGTGNDTIWGNDGDDTIYGNEDNDTLYAGIGNDYLDGGAGNDSIIGQSGGNTLIGGAGMDTLTGGTDIDLVSYAYAANGVFLYLDSAATVAPGTDEDVLSGIENALGSDYADMITANSAGSTIDGADGDDTLYGGDGADSILGSAGNDIISGGDGLDTLDGGTGVNTIDYSYATVGIDANLYYSTVTVVGGTDVDTVSNFQALIGSSHDDVIVGSTSSDTLMGMDGGDKIVGGAGNDTSIGGAGDDTLESNDGYDTLYGGDGNDTLNGGSEDDFLMGGDGNDQLIGETGYDTASYTYLDTGSVGVTFNFNTGATVAAGTDVDTISSIEAVIGSSHVDTITGSTSASDTIIGGGGADMIYLQAGQSSLLMYTAQSDCGDGVDSFTSGQDVFKFDSTNFDSSAASRFMTISNFDGSTGLADSQAYFVYDDVTHELYYDADGNSSSAATLVAQLTNSDDVVQTDISF